MVRMLRLNPPIRFLLISIKAAEKIYRVKKSQGNPWDFPRSILNRKLTDPQILFYISIITDL